jgi:hypothetical protein
VCVCGGQKAPKWAGTHRQPIGAGQEGWAALVVGGGPGLPLAGRSVDLWWAELEPVRLHTVWPRAFLLWPLSILFGVG